MNDTNGQPSKDEIQSFVDSNFLSENETVSPDCQFDESKLNQALFRLIGHHRTLLAPPKFWTKSVMNKYDNLPKIWWLFGPLWDAE